MVVPTLNSAKAVFDIELVAEKENVAWSNLQVTIHGCSETVKNRLLSQDRPVTDESKL